MFKFKYIKKLISATSEESHKRFIALLAFACLPICIIANFFGKIIQVETIYTLGALSSLQSCFTILEKIKEWKEKK